MENYKILGTFNLDEVYHLPTSSLYRFLKPLKKNYFNDNERIVFYNYGKIGIDILEHLYQTLLYLDIPEYFVMVVSNQITTKEYLIEKIIVELTDHPVQNTDIKPMQFNTYNNYCAHAWVGLHVTPDGKTKPCCEFEGFIPKSDGSLYNINNSNFDEIINSNWMKNFRQDFRDNKQPSGCQNCFKRESLGFDSRKSLSPYKLENIYGYINWEDEGQLMYFGSHLGNLCNLKCRICDENFSSSIASEEILQITPVERKQSIYYAALKSSNWVFKQKFWDLLKKNSSTIKNFEILGGEPFILKENNQFIKWLVDNKLSRDICFYFSTNGTQYPDIVDYSSEFKRIEITISVDNIGERFEFERHGANFNLVESNIKNMVQQSNNYNTLKIDHCITVSIQNIFYIPEILRWSRDIGFNSYYINYVEEPLSLSLGSLTKNAKEIILNKLTTSVINNSYDQSIIDSIIAHLRQQSTSNGIEFCKKMKHLDQIRNQNFSNLYPEISETMGYNNFS